VCVGYSYAPYRRSGSLSRGICVNLLETKIAKWWCRENWNGTGCSREEEELDETDYRYLLRRITELKVETVDDAIRLINFIDNLL